MGPREQVLAEKGQDWKKIDEQLESLKIKEPNGDEFGKRGCGSGNGNGRAAFTEDRSERSWRKAASDDGHSERAEYDPKNDLLDQEFMLKGKWYHRKDIEIKNSRGDVLQCSHYLPIVSPEGKALPCVIYCHGNSGCRADASEAAIILLPLLS